MRRLSLRSRFALLAALLVLVIGALVAAGGYLTLRGSLLGQAQRQARDQARQLVSLIDVPTPRGGSEQQGNRVDISDPSLSHEFLRQGLAVRIERPDGRIIQASPDARALPRLSGSLRARCLGLGEASARLSTPPVALSCHREGSAGRPAAIVEAASSLDSAWHLLAVLRNALALGVLAGGIVAGALALGLAQRALRPARRIAATAESIRAGNLARRIDDRGPPDELGRLADTLDACFDELEQAVERQRRFVADASHELKTPVAAIRAHIELLRDWAGVDPDAREAALRSLDQAARAAARLVSDLLYLAQLDREPPSRRISVALDQVLLDVVREARPLRQDVAIRVDRLDEAQVNGDELQLQQLLLNLLDNALRVSPGGGEVLVALETGGDSATVSVSDQGPGIPPAELERVFDRFHSVDLSARSRRGVG
ncbi:MAG: HAMP domain-containing histidine kinase, partial [Actinomycetota bacterium]|nr:HAMP domain-containing histidine kinase [Actinomycetota bacterium]